MANCKELILLLLQLQLLLTSCVHVDVPAHRRGERLPVGSSSRDARLTATVINEGHPGFLFVKRLALKTDEDARYTCNDASDCELTGDCVHGMCDCHPGWLSTGCSACDGAE